MTQSTVITVSWIDPTTGGARQEIATAPIVFGRVAIAMPTTINGVATRQIEFGDSDISRFHLLLDWQGDRLVATDQNSRNGSFLNGKRLQSDVVPNGGQLQMGATTVAISYAVASIPAASEGAGGITPAGEAATEGTIIRRVRTSREILAERQIDPRDIQSNRLPMTEVDFASVGGGLGSYIWADYLRIFGARTEQIAALGMREPAPYANYKRLCLNSQIPLHERLRSNSDSCPDNIWGWPGYALREAWHDVTRGSAATALRYLWQVFSEPTLSETYTPRAGRVFDSIDREARRIGWERIWRYGRVKAIRQTTDGRYAISYAQSDEKRDPAFMIARYVVVATGYPKIQFLPDLQAYREQYEDFRTVVNAYEDHSHVYQQLAQQGGTILLRGRGIVASRIIQRITEIRQQTGRGDIRVLHLMRSPKNQGNKFRFAKRAVSNHFEFQPFNWPKACWGGDLREVLEKANDSERDALIKSWGGTTTADRRDWREIVDRSLREGWYSIQFGNVSAVTPNPNGGTLTKVTGNTGEQQVNADFIVDATGLDAEVKYNPMLEDLVNHYQLPLNPRRRLAVNNSFEIQAMRQRQGRIYAIGAISFGGPYAAVDSFLGLQFSSQWVLDDMVKADAPGLRRLDGWASFNQWMKWATNQAPN
ncbi:MAG: FHA domain-containing protein [Cyanobacteria bacterium P01_E01_bin.34]